MSIVKKNLQSFIWPYISYQLSFLISQGTAPSMKEEKNKMSFIIGDYINILSKRIEISWFELHIQKLFLQAHLEVF